MLTTIIKRNGSEEEFIASKLNKWLIWASKDLGDRVDWATIARGAVKKLGEKATSQELQQALIDECLNKRDWPHSCMAGMLYGPLLQKKLYGDIIPTIQEQHRRMVEKGYMEVMGYTDEEYDYLEGIIDHTRDYQYAHFQFEQLHHKYSLANRVTGEKYETPQFIMMRMAMELSKDESDRLQSVVDYYHAFSLNQLNPPTPNYINLGTEHKGLASCCLIYSGDDRFSIGIANWIAYIMTCNSAGIGLNMDVRSVGDPVRGGLVKHQGKHPYNILAGANVRANRQGGRGGALTSYYSAYDPESIFITMAQNPRTPADAQNRQIHFAFMFNRHFAEKVLRNEEIYQFTPQSSPELTEAFYRPDYQDFKTKYEEFAAKQTEASRKKSARQIWNTVKQQTHEVATLYLAQMDEINRHTPFKDPIHSSNLCVAPWTNLTTRDGQNPITDYVNQEVEIWNGQEYTIARVEKTAEQQILTRVIVQVTQGGQETSAPLDCTDAHRWYIDSGNGEIVELRTIDLKVGMQLEEWEVEENDLRFKARATVIEIHRDLGIVADTYCVREPKRNRAMFNGIVTGQCLEITQPTIAYTDMQDLYRIDHHRGEISFCSLAGVIVPNIPDDQTYAKVALLALKMIDYCIDNSEYSFPHAHWTSINRRNAGVGIVGLATVLAREGLKYDTPEGLQRIDEIAETHFWHIANASLQLGIERGNAPWMDRTKWPEGWLPIDTYKKAVDELVPHNPKRDWEGLRARIIQNGGIRHSSLIAHMPTESSSKAAGVANSVLPIREAAMMKTDHENKIDWHATDYDILGDKYQRAYDISTINMLKAYAVIQKWTDQAISADAYKDRVREPNLSTDDFAQELMTMVKYGIKTQYYQNSYTGDSKKVDTIEGSAFQQPNTPIAPEEVLVAVNDRAECAGGMCTL